MPDDAKILANLVRRMHAEQEDPLSPLIDAYFLERGRSEKRLNSYNISFLPQYRPPGRFSPSTICGCERQAAFKFLGVPGRTRLDPDLESLFEDGNWRHHRWQATFRDMELVLGPSKLKVISIEEKVELPELFIAGALDVVLKINGKKWVIDLKGINDYGFSRLTLYEEPLEPHVLQLLSYMKSRGIPRGMLFYENKNNQQRRIFIIKFSPKKWKEVQEWCNRVINRMRKKELPPMSLDCQAGNYLFEKCPWSHLCYGTNSHERVRRKAYKEFNTPEEAWSSWTTQAK